jgi:hypothetical protein
MRVAT